MSENKQTIQDFIARHGLTFSATPTSENRNMLGDEKWAKTASHWVCTIGRPGVRRPMVVSYSMGAAHRQWDPAALNRYHGTYTRAEIAKFSPVLGDRGIAGYPESIALRELREQCTIPTPPTLADVLDCLALDAAGFDDARDFEDWAAEFGYDTDSRKAEAVYRLCGEQAKELRHVLGATAYSELLYDTERL